MKNTRYKKGLVEIVKREEKARCSRCSRETAEPFEIRRAGKTVGRYGPRCIEHVEVEIIKANDSSSFGLVVPGLDFVDYFKRPKVRDVREFERKEPKGNKRMDVMGCFLRLKDGEYMHVPKETALHPNIKNWRKKGHYISVRVPSKEQAKEEKITPKDAAKDRIGKNFLAYAGLMYFNRADNRNRMFSFMSLIEGKKIAYLCRQDGIEEKIEIESDQGPNKILWVPSTSRKGEYHRVKLKNLPVEKKDMYSRAFEIDYESTSEDSIYSNLPWSDAGMPDGEHYRFSPVRPDKSACAALEYLMSREDNDILADPRPFVPSNLACKLENRLLTRAVQGSELLDGQDIEVQMWMAATGLGYDKMCE